MTPVNEGHGAVCFFCDELPTHSQSKNQPPDILLGAGFRFVFLRRTHLSVIVAAIVLRELGRLATVSWAVSAS